MSHANQGLIAVTLVLLFAAGAAAEPAVISTKLNLRAGPGPAFGVIAVMPAGAKLDVQKCGDEWCRVKYGRQVGYASSAYIDNGANSYASAAQPAPAPVEPRPTLTGPRVWQWRDDDWRDDHWRDIEWRNRLNRR